MITGDPDGDWADISECGTWRYMLGRRFAPGPVLGWIMFNPSKADAEISDPTVAKCVTITRLAGYGGLLIGNEYALRSADPAAVRTHWDPIGPDCDYWLAWMLRNVPRVVLAWGNQGGQCWASIRRQSVVARVTGSGIPVACLGTTRSGEPRHPCRLANATRLVPWELP